MKLSDNSVKDLIKQAGLSATFIDQVQQGYAPLASYIAKQRQCIKPLTGVKPLIIGINGCPGSGKSTLSLFLKYLLQQTYQMNTVVLSIDDFYLTRQERIIKAQQQHPLFKIRGVPGTHDLPLLSQTLKALLAGQPVLLPRFDKAMDDRMPESCWHPYHQLAEVIVIEGWCVGTPAQKEEALLQPVNTLEEQEDSHCVWRTAVNRYLDTHYADFFKQINEFIYLKPPSLEHVFAWRMKQEDKLKQCSSLKNKSMGANTLRRFLHTYERLMQHALNVMPAKANVLVTLDSEQQWVSIDYDNG